MRYCLLAAAVAPHKSKIIFERGENLQTTKLAKVTHNEPNFVVHFI